MNGMNETCPECEAELAPGARFCPRCGGFTGVTVPRPVPGGQPTVTQQAVTQPPPQWPGGQPTAVQQAVPQPQWPGGPGRTVMVSPPPGRAGRMPRAALPAAPSAAPPLAEQPADATRSDWSAPPTVTRQPAYPQSPPPFQPPPQQSPQPFQAFPQPPSQQPPPRYPQDGYAPGGYPQGAYPQDGYAPTGYAPGGYPQDRRPQDGYEPTEYAPRRAGGPGGFEPSPPYQGPPPEGQQEAPRQPPRRHDRDGGRRGVPLALWIVLVVLLAGGAGAVLKLAHPFGHATPGTASGASAGASGSASAGRATPGGTASPGTASGTASAATEQQAAAGVAALLSQSAADRTATNTAASDIASCGPNLQTDPAVFGKAVTSRQALLAKLAALPGRTALPATLVSDLTGAWQASIAADQAYAKWANDELAKTCVPNDTADPGFQATVTPNQQATTDKTQFAADWQPVAAKYGLTQYQPGQL